MADVCARCAEAFEEGDLVCSLGYAIFCEPCAEDVQFEMDEDDAYEAFQDEVDRHTGEAFEKTKA